MDARDARPTAFARRPPRRLRRDPRRRPPRAPPLRVVLELRRGVRGAGGRRPRRPRDQADAVPDVVRQPHHPLADPRRRARASRSWPSWSSRRASTRRRTSRSRGRWSMRASTSCTAWWASRHTRRPVWSCAARTTGSVGTPTSAPGNYNSSTARLYEDLGLLTADPDLGADLTDLFNLLTGYSRQREYRKLLVAPVTMRPGLAELIRREAQRTRRLHRAEDEQPRRRGSDRRALRGVAGRRADRPPGARDLLPAPRRARACRRTIRVRSIVGRFLEHSRVYRFGSPEPRPHLPDRLRGPDAAQPRPPRRGADPGRRTPRCRRASTRSSRSSSRTTSWPGSSTPRRDGTRWRRERASTRSACCRSSPSRVRRASDEG